MHRRWLTFGTASLLLLGVSSADAQAPVLERGARIRVLAPVLVTESGDRLPTAGPIEGWFARRTADSLWLRRDPVDETLIAVGLGTVERLQVSLGKKRNTLKGTLWGGGVGLTLGILTALALPDCGVLDDDWLWWCEGDEALVIFGTALPFAGLGALLGTFIRTERWGDIPPATLTLYSEDGHPGIAVRLRLQL